MPATPHDAKGLIKASIRDNDPVIYFEHKALYRRIKQEIPEGDYTVPIGPAAVVREGRDLSIITYGAMVWVAQEVAETLDQEGVSVEIVDVRTLLPLDEATILASVRKTSRVLVLHEATLTGGVGGEIAARIAEKAFDCLDAPVVRVAAPDTPVPFSPPLEKAFLPNAAKVLEKARWLLAY
jgi:2-oxoisovalerate dehydrogenase E1 component beta subunit